MNTKEHCGHFDRFAFVKLKHILPELEYKRIARDKKIIIELIVDRIRSGVF
jgi:hypothetical protein